MRRFTRFLFCTALLCLSLCATALANEYVFDDGFLLPEEQTAELERQAQTIAEQYNFGVYLIIVNNFEEYGYSDPYDCAVAFYRDSNFGLGDGNDGELLFMSMDDRQYALVYHGSGDTVFTEGGRDIIEDAMLPRFRDDDWYGGFMQYYRQSAYLLSEASEGEPVGWEEYGDYHPDDGDIHEERESGFSWIGLLITLGGSALVAGLICAGFASQLTSVQESSQAASYVKSNSLNLRSRSDRYTHTTETRTKIEKSSSSSRGGGGSSHHSGGGYSGRSGSF